LPLLLVTLQITCEVQLNFLWFQEVQEEQAFFWMIMSVLLSTVIALYLGQRKNLSPAVS
jgi:hypothetical protein